jgi:hypothetical protein
MSAPANRRKLDRVTLINMLTLDVRTPVLLFALAMEDVLRQHDDEKGNHGWENLTPSDCFNRMHDELREFHDRLLALDRDGALREAVDIGNFAMMAYDNITALQEERPCPRT